MSAVDRISIKLGLCPSPGKTKGIWYRTPSKEIRYTKIDENRIKISIPLIEAGRQISDQIIRIALCPEGHACGCDYTAEIGWLILEDCAANLFWRWPEAAGCLLKQGGLVGSKTGTVFNEQLANDPEDVIYPVGDSHNPECPGCGLSGKDRQAQVDLPVPGEQFILTGCFDEEACIEMFGALGCRPIGQELFQTVGFMGGLIHDVFDEEARAYEVWVDGELTGAQGTDLTKYTIGQWVPLAKVGTEFPVDEWEERVPVTNVNVPTVGAEEYIIIPYQFAAL